MTQLNPERPACGQSFAARVGSLLLRSAAILIVVSCQSGARDALEENRKDALVDLQYELTAAKISGSAYTLIRNLPACPTALWHPKAQSGRVLMGRDFARQLKEIYSKPGSTDALMAATMLGHFVGTLENAMVCGRAGGMQEQVLLGYKEVLLEILFSDVLPADQSFFLSGPKLSWKDRPRAEVEKDLEQMMRAASKPGDWQIAFHVLARSACKDQAEQAYSLSSSIILGQLHGSGQCPSCEGMNW